MYELRYLAPTFEKRDQFSRFVCLAHTGQVIVLYTQNEAKRA